jgi:hypothetical protein
MPKNLTPAMRAHLDAETTKLAAIWQITRKDGQQFFFTDHDRDILFAGDIYRADAGFERTAIRSDAGFAVDNLDLVGVFAEGGIVEDEVRAGLFDGAEIRISFVNWQDPDGHGEVRLRRGTLGETRLTPQGYFTAELRGLAQPLAQSTLQLWSPECRADLGDSRCTVPIWPDEVARATAYTAGQFVRVSDPPGGPLAEDYDDRIYECVTAGTTDAVQPTYDTTLGNNTTDGTAVFRAYHAFTRAAATAAVTSDRELIPTAALDAYATGWFDDGLLVWETGANAEVGYEVKGWSQATRTLTLWESARQAVEVGDKFRVAPGCHKRLVQDCRDKFALAGSVFFANGNAKNFRGEPFVPGSGYAAINPLDD